MDAIDVAVADIDQDSLQVIAYEQIDFPEAVQHKVRALNANSSIDTVTELDVSLARLFADAIQQVLDKHQLKSSDILAAGHHGQTILHLPDPPYPRTLQIGDGNTIAALTGIPIVTDFRRMDMAVGGQGAPLAPAFHAWYFQSRKDLLDQLLAQWETQNTQAIVTHAARPAGNICRAVMHLFECFIDPDQFDPRLDFAVREWARRDAQGASSDEVLSLAR